MVLTISQRYLKHEVAAALDEGDAPGRFTSLSWHPEKPLNFLLTTPGLFELLRFDSHLTNAKQDVFSNECIHGIHSFLGLDPRTILVQLV